MDAFIEERDGQLVMVDPVGHAVAVAVMKHACKATLEDNAERIEHFRRRAVERGDDPTEVVIVVCNMDDPLGFALGDKLMPGYDWQQFRVRGEVPFARGLAGREGVLEWLGIVDAAAADKLRRADGIAVVVVDYAVCDVF